MNNEFSQYTPEELLGKTVLYEFGTGSNKSLSIKKIVKVHLKKLQT